MGRGGGGQRHYVQHSPTIRLKAVGYGTQHGMAAGTHISDYCDASDQHPSHGHPSPRCHLASSRQWGPMFVRDYFPGENICGKICCLESLLLYNDEHFGSATPSNSAIKRGAGMNIILPQLFW